MLAWHQWLSSALVNFNLHTGINVAIKSFLFVCVIFVNVCAELIIADLVSLLILTVIWQVLLNCIIGKMDTA
jgi:hypothetical protein